MRITNSTFDLASLLSQSLKGLDLDTRIKESTCVLVWDEVVGEQVSAAAQPDFVRDGKLFVTTKSPVWANELTFYKADMINRLNRRVGGTVLKDITFKAGRIDPKRPTRKPSASAPDLESMRLTPEEIAKIEATASAAGEDLSGGLRDLLITAAKLDKWRRTQGWTPCKVCGVLQRAPSGVCPPCERETGRS